MISARTYQKGRVKAFYDAGFRYRSRTTTRLGLLCSPTGDDGAGRAWRRMLWVEDLLEESIWPVMCDKTPRLPPSRRHDGGNHHVWSRHFRSNLVRRAATSRIRRNFMLGATPTTGRLFPSNGQASAAGRFRAWRFRPKARKIVVLGSITSIFFEGTWRRKGRRQAGRS